MAEENTLPRTTSAYEKVGKGLEWLTGPDALNMRDKVGTYEGWKEKAEEFAPRLTDKGAEYSESGGVIINPLEANKVWSHNEVFKYYTRPTTSVNDQNYFKDNNIQSLSVNNGGEAEIVDIEGWNYDKIINFMDTHTVVNMGVYNRDGSFATNINLNEFVGENLDKQIESRISADQKKWGSRTWLDYNPFLDVENPFNMYGWGTKKTKDGKEYPSLMHSPGVEAENLYKSITKRFPKLPEKTKWALINREVYGREDATPIAPSLGKGSSRISSTSERFWHMFKDIPRGYGDLAQTVVGYATEKSLGFGMAVGDWTWVRSGVNNAVKDITGVDIADKVPDFTGSPTMFADLPNIASEKGRDRARKWLGPDAAQTYQLSLAADNIKVTEEQANWMLHYGFNLADKIKVNLPLFALEAAFLAKMGIKKSEKIFEEFKLFVGKNPQMKMKNTPEEIIEKFLATEHKKSWPVFGAIAHYIKKNRIKDGSQISESKLPVGQRSLVIEAKDAVKHADKIYKDALNKRRLELLEIDKKFPKSKYPDRIQEPLIGGKDVLHAKAKKEAALIKVRLAERTSEVPQFLRDMYRDTTVFALAASVTSQTMIQTSNLPPEIAYLGGMGALISYSLLSNVSPRGIPILGRLGMDMYLNQFPTLGKDNLNVFKYINEIDKDAALEGFKSKGELAAFLTNPKLQNLSRGKRALATELAQKLNALAPEVRDQIIANIEYYRTLRNKMSKSVKEGGLGVDDDLLAESFGTMSGLSFFSALEDSFVHSLAEKKVFDKNTSEILAKIQNQKTEMIVQLKNSLGSILNISGAKENAEIVELSGYLTKAIKSAEESRIDLQLIGNAFVDSKVRFLKSIISGNADKNAEAEMVNQYGSLDSFVESIGDDIIKKHTSYKADKSFLSSGEDIKNIQAARAEIDKLQAEVTQKMTDDLSGFNDALDMETKQVGTITYQIKNYKGRSKVSLDKDASDTVENLGKYNDENAAMARLATLNKTFAQLRASLPFEQFDQKYTNRFGTDASSIGDKIVSDILRVNKKDKALNNLVDSNMLSSDDKALFDIFNDSAEKTLRKIEEEGGATIEDLITEIQNANPEYTGNISFLEVYHYLKETDPKGLGGKIGLSLNIGDTLKLNQALGKKSWMFRKTDKHPTYLDWKNEAGKLWENIIDVTGKKDARITSRIQAEITEMNNNYQEQFTSIYTGDGKVAKWMEATRTKKIKADSREYPGGIEWTGNNHPSNWFDLNKIQKLDDTQVQLESDELNKMFGMWDSGLGKHVIDPKGENFKLLKRIATIKYKREFAKLQRTITDPDKLRDALDNLDRKTQLLFRANSSKNLNETPSAFNALDIQDELLTLPSRIGFDETIASKVETELGNVDIISKRDKAKITKEITRENNNIALLKRMNDGGNTNKDFFQFVVGSAKGADNFRIMKDAVVKSGQMTEKEFVVAARTIIADHIHAITVAPTGVRIITKTKKKGPFGKNNHTFEVIDDVDLNADELVNIFNNKVEMQNIKNLGLMDQKQIDTLKTFAEFMQRRKVIHNRRSQMRFTGVPRGLSVESYISRFYSISRGVVSPKYVGTEALLQSLRAKQHSMLKAMIADPEIAEIMTDLIVRGEKFTEQKELRLKELLIAMAAKTNTQAQMSTVFFKNDLRDFRKYPVTNLRPKRKKVN